MLHQQGVPEEEEALRESPEDAPGAATEKAPVGDVQEEFCPLLSDIQEEHTECEAEVVGLEGKTDAAQIPSPEAQVLQQEEPVEEQNPPDSPDHAVEGAAEEPLVSSSREEAGPPQAEQHGEHLENEVASDDSHDSDGQAAGSPRSLRSWATECSCTLMDQKEFLERVSSSLADPGSGAPSGYLPYYRTCSQFQEREEAPAPPDRADTSPSARGSSPDKARGQEGGAEAEPSREGSPVKPHPEKGPLPPSLEEAAGRNRQGPAVVAKRREQPGPTPTCPPASSRSSSQRGVNSLLQWVRNIFSWPSLVRQPPSPAPVEERGHGHLGTRIRGWLRKHRGRVHPHSR